MHAIDQVLAYFADNWWVGVAALVWLMIVVGELRQVTADWKVRRMARQREAELRKIGLIR